MTRPDSTIYPHYAPNGVPATPAPLPEDVLRDWRAGDWIPHPAEMLPSATPWPAPSLPISPFPFPLSPEAPFQPKVQPFLPADLPLLNPWRPARPIDVSPDTDNSTPREGSGRLPGRVSPEGKPAKPKLTPQQAAEAQRAKKELSKAADWLLGDPASTDNGTEHTVDKMTGTPFKRTYLCFLLDSSGSMLKARHQTIEGYNEQVAIVQDNAEDAGDTSITLFTFSYRPYCVYSQQPLETLAYLDTQSYNPTGGTALYDALGDALAQLEAAPGIDDADTAVLVAVFTDGEDTCSRCHTANDIKARIQALEATGRWTFTFIGPKDKLAEASDILALDPSNMVGFEPDSAESRQQVIGALSNATASYLQSRAEGRTQVYGLYQPK